MPENKRYAEAYWVESRNRWQVKVQVDGVRKTFTSGTPGRRGKSEAERKADVWLDTHKEPEKSRFWPLYEEHLQDVKIRTGEGNYANAESLGRIWLKPTLEHRRVSTITVQDWQLCINKAKEAGKSLKTLKNIRGAISSFCHYCKKRDIQIADTELVDMPTHAPKGIKVVLQPEQLRLLFSDDTTKENRQIAPAFFIHAWRFCVLTGLRKGELLGLKRSDIDVKSKTIHIQRSINKFNHEGPTKTAKSDRVFLLNKHMRNVLDEQAKMLKEQRIISPWIFPDESGDHPAPGTFYGRWCSYCKYHGFKTTLHELRHTLISIAKAGMSAELLKPMVGHTETMNTFGVYGHQLDGEMKMVADTLDALFDQHLKGKNEDAHQ